MKLYAPKYYKEFNCIAEECKHSCCIGWEIDIDSLTLDKYKKLSQGYGKSIIESIDSTETPHFRLCEGERCPHLNKSGLCEIILNLGEGYLCDICREHPRFYNTAVDRKEVGLGMACEEACRIILNSDGYGEFVEIGDTDGEEYEGINTLEYRQRIFDILSDGLISFNEKINRISAEYGVSPADISDGEWRDIISRLEYLDENHKTAFFCYSSKTEVPNELENGLIRALAYFIFRHCAELYYEAEFRESLGFCLFCVKLLASVAVAQNAENITELIPIARTVSEEIEYSEENTEAIKYEFSLIY